MFLKMLAPSNHDCGATLVYNLKKKHKFFFMNVIHLWRFTYHEDIHLFYQNNLCRNFFWLVKCFGLTCVCFTEVLNSDCKIGSDFCIDKFKF